MTEAHIAGIRPQAVGALFEAVRVDCGWLFLHADLDHRTRPPMMLPNGQHATWMDRLSMQERGLVEAAIAAGVWLPPEGPEPPADHAAA